MATRATKSADWAILKLNNSDDLEHLRSLQFKEKTIVFFRVIDGKTGRLNPDLLSSELLGTLVGNKKSVDIEKRFMEAIMQLKKATNETAALFAKPSSLASRLLLKSNSPSGVGSFTDEKMLF